MDLAPNSFDQSNFIYEETANLFFRVQAEQENFRDDDGPPQGIALKGQCQENFYFRLFLVNHLPLGPPLIRFASFRFFRKLSKIFATQGAPLVSFILKTRVLKLLWSPVIDSKDSIPPAYVACRAGTITPFLRCSYCPRRLFKNSGTGLLEEDDLWTGSQKPSQPTSQIVNRVSFTSTVEPQKYE
jgi:hypothetical protein